MNIPIIIFNGSTDYDAVLETTKRLQSEMLHSNDCGCVNVSNCLCSILGYIFAADWNKSHSSDIKYQEAVKAAYLSLNCNC